MVPAAATPARAAGGAILRFRTAQKVYEKELSGGEANTTNNRMEMTALLEALRQLKEPCAIDLYSDSKYVIDSAAKGLGQGVARPRLEESRQIPRPEPGPVGPAAGREREA